MGISLKVIINLLFRENTSFLDKKYYKEQTHKVPVITPHFLYENFRCEIILNIKMHLLPVSNEDGRRKNKQKFNSSRN